MPTKPRKILGVVPRADAERMTDTERLEAQARGWLMPMAGSANDLITPSVIARAGLATLYNNLVVSGLIWRDFDPDFRGKQGDTITIRKPAVFTARDFVRATGIELQAIDEDSMPLVLNKFKDVSVAVTSEELTLELDAFNERVLTPMMQAIIEAVDGDVAAALIDASNDAGAGGTVTMDEKASDAFARARERLTRNKAPLTNRYAVLSPEGTTEGLLDVNILNAEKSGSTDALRNASIGRVFGLESYETQSFGHGPGAVGQADGVAFHKTAVTLATRALETPMGVAPSQVAVESYQGITIRVVQDYDVKYKQDVVSADILYGTAKTRPELAVALDLGQGS